MSTFILIVALAALGLVVELGLWWRRRRKRRRPVRIRCRMFSEASSNGWNRIVLFRGRETYLFYWRDADLGPLLCQFGALADNPELELCWKDASRLADGAWAFQTKKKAVSSRR